MRAFVAFTIVAILLSGCIGGAKPKADASPSSTEEEYLESDRRSSERTASSGEEGYEEETEVGYLNETFSLKITATRTAGLYHSLIFESTNCVAYESDSRILEGNATLEWTASNDFERELTLWIEVDYQRIEMETGASPLVVPFNLTDAEPGRYSGYMFTVWPGTDGGVVDLPVTLSLSYSHEAPAKPAGRETWCWLAA